MLYAWRVLLVGSILVVRVAPAQPAAQISVTTHVRSSDPVVRQALAEGIRNSPTLARLIGVLDASDVVVYLETDIRPLPGLEAYLSHQIVATAQARYIRVAVRRPFDEQRILSVIAHELQHAIEISSDRTVRTTTDMERLFRHIGRPDCPGACYETVAARAVERQVADEVAKALQR